MFLHQLRLLQLFLSWSLKGLLRLLLLLLLLRLLRLGLRLGLDQVMLLLLLGLLGLLGPELKKLLLLPLQKLLVKLELELLLLPLLLLLKQELPLLLLQKEQLLLLLLLLQCGLRRRQVFPSGGAGRRHRYRGRMLLSVDRPGRGTSGRGRHEQGNAIPGPNRLGLHACQPRQPGHPRQELTPATSQLHPRVRRRVCSGNGGGDRSRTKYRRVGTPASPASAPAPADANIFYP